MKWFKPQRQAQTSCQSPHLTIGLVGNPNCGKTTLFNHLTGSHQRVGNWPGVTVERKSGYFTENQTTVEVIDLPGVYSLTVVSETSSIDERIACEAILSQDIDLIINILDASNLERHLYLTLQLIEMRVPMIIAVNMMDVARQRNVQIALELLQDKLGCPVIAIEANKGQGIIQLKQLCLKQIKTDSNPLWLTTYPDIHQAIIDLTQQTRSEFLALRLLEEDVSAQKQVSSEVITQVKMWQQHIHKATGEDTDIVLADARYQFIQATIKKCIIKTATDKTTFTSKIDNIVLNRLLGIPIFLVIMYAMFFFSINIGGAFQDFFDIASNTLFVGGLDYLLTQAHVPVWLTALIANGIGKGINTTLTFIPVIGALFLFLAFLEDSGYMARAAFVVDRFMRVLGLPGKSFVPMIVGFGCNVPSVMSARTLDNKRDRILTVMMSPFMSCGARLAIYAVFTAAFFPVGGHNIIFMLYVIGIIVAMLTGFLLRKTVLSGDPAALIMELPPYHVPNIKTLFLHAWQRLKGFVLRAGKLIIPICIVIGALNSINLNGTLNTGAGDTHSILSTFGQWLTPVFAPMGIHQDNWPATVGLLTGVLAKEVVVGTLNTLYTQLGHFSAVTTEVYSLWGGLHEAVSSIPANLGQLINSLNNPILAKAPVHTLSQSIYGLMYQRFDGQIGAIAYLLFVLLYFPCISTTAAMLREVHKVWTVFSVLWTTGLAYCFAVVFYQAATCVSHPIASFIWISSIAGFITFAIMCMRVYATHDSKQETHYGIA